MAAGALWKSRYNKSRLAHVKNSITREELLQELDLYASGKLTGFTIA
jgi:hypothetical protein